MITRFLMLGALATFQPVAASVAQDIAKRSPPDQARRCDPIACFRPERIRPARYDGKFLLWFQQYECRQAPCPPGSWVVSIRNVRQGSGRTRLYLPIPFDRFEYADGTPQSLRLTPVPDDVERRFVRIDGVIAFNADHSVASITPRSAEFQSELKL